MPRPITVKFLDAARALKSADHSPAASEKPALEKHQDAPSPTPPTIDQVVDKILVRFDKIRIKNLLPKNWVPCWTQRVDSNSSIRW